MKLDWNLMRVILAHIESETIDAPLPIPRDWKGILEAVAPILVTIQYGL